MKRFFKEKFKKFIDFLWQEKETNIHTNHINLIKFSISLSTLCQCIICGFKIIDRKMNKKPNN